MTKDKKETVVKKTDKKSVDDILAKIHKAHGKESIRKYADTAIADVDVISTGSMKLDNALYIGGLPRGRIVELFGLEMSGKTSVSLQVIAQAQKMGELAAFIDAEHSLSQSLATGIGVNLDDLLISQPDTGEEALDIVDMLVESGKVAIIVIDSVSALVPRAELEGDMGDQQMGLQARLMGKAMRKLTGKVSKSNTCVVFINQLREKIGVFFGDPNVTPGGKALKFFSSIRLDVRKIGSIKKGQDQIGNRIKITVVKNKLAPPYRVIETDLLFGKGIDFYGEVLDLGKEHDLIEQNGPWFSYGEERIGQGREKACEFLKSNPKIIEKILKEIKEG